MENNTNQATHLKREILVRIIKSFCSKEGFYTDEEFAENARLIPMKMRPKGCEVPYRCCVYKERAIIKDRTIAGLGFAIEDDDETTLLSTYAKKALERNELDNKPLTVLEAACKGCVPSRVYVTDLCQGCVARPCIHSCSFGAIQIINGKSIIDGTKCKNCGKCIQVCPYHAITKIIVPCENACPVDAIEKDDSGHAKIDFDKCIVCGKCVIACPFGAVHEKSQIIDILKQIKAGKKVVALVAPAIVGQLPYSLYQVKSAIMKAGFSDVLEVAQGADITALTEAADFVERVEQGDKFMTTSCCAAYNSLVENHLPEIKPFVSQTKTPLYYTAEIAKKACLDCVTVFMSPCSAKRREGMENPNVDFVMNFEELGALFIALKIEVANCEESKFAVESSKEGRNFALTGGVAKSVEVALQGEVECKPVIISGLSKQSIRELRRYAKEGVCELGNLIEIMSCEGGCIGGNANLNSIKKAHKQISDFTEDSKPLR